MTVKMLAAYYSKGCDSAALFAHRNLVYLPRKNHLDKPAMIIELKWDKSTEGAIAQIKKQKYIQALESYTGNLLLVGINYNRKNKTHECSIEKIIFDHKNS